MIIKTPKIRLLDSLIYNGCHSLCLINLLSLETNLIESDEALLDSKRDDYMMKLLTAICIC